MAKSETTKSASTRRVSKVAPAVEEQEQTETQPNRHEQLQLASYYLWEQRCNGSPVDEATTISFWLEAEKQLEEQ